MYSEWSIVNNFSSAAIYCSLVVHNILIIDMQNQKKNERLMIAIAFRRRGEVIVVGCFVVQLQPVGNAEWLPSELLGVSNRPPWNNAEQLEKPPQDSIEVSFHLTFVCIMNKKKMKKKEI